MRIRVRIRSSHHNKNNNSNNNKNPKSKAAHLGTRFHRRCLRPWAWHAGRWRRGEESSSSALVTFETKHECRETCSEMLHFNLRGYISHIAEVTVLLREMRCKPFIVTLNETFLRKAIDNVKLEGYQILARRDRGGQWGR